MRVAFGAYGRSRVKGLPGGFEHRSHARASEQHALGIGIRLGRQLDALGHHVKTQARASAEVERMPLGARRSALGSTMRPALSMVEACFMAEGVGKAQIFYLP